MNVKLIAITKSVIEEKELSAEELITYIARVSNPSNQLNTDTSSKLLKYLIDHKHWSPFEQASMTVEIVTSRTIAHQILRHRSFSFQEFSQRYSEALKIESIQLRKQADKNRQSSTELIDDKEDEFLQNQIYSIFTQANQLYKYMISTGVAKECARFVLPESMQTTLYMTGSVRSWIHYLQIRCDEHTQLEHREIANEIKKIFKQYFPNISESLDF